MFLRFKIKKRKMERQYTIAIFCVAASGHLNPLVSLANEMNKYKNCRIIFYGNMQHKKLIESSKSEFRNLEVEDPAEKFNPNETRNELHIDAMMGFMMLSFVMCAPEVRRLFEKVPFFLVIFDYFTGYIRMAVEKLKRLEKEGKLKKRLPKFATFCPSFMMDEKIFPNEAEKFFVPKPKITLGFLVTLQIWMAKYLYFSWRHSLPLLNTKKMMFPEREALNLCCIIPEFQPRASLFPKSVKFIGSCASEEIRSVGNDFDEPLKSFMEPFKPINPLPLDDNFKIDKYKLASNTSTSIKLIYASFGTAANRDPHQYIKVIESLKLLSSKDPIKSDEIRLLLSVGKESYAQMQQMIEQKSLQMPSNVLMMERVPQLDVLKRASLFVTHCGQNSVSESMHYGVPMIGIPVMGDQLIVAYRMADELGLGKSMGYDEASPETIKQAITDIMGDESYLERTILYSKISRKYNGIADGAKLMFDYLTN